MDLLVLLVIALFALVLLSILDWAVRCLTVKSAIKIEKAHVLITGGSSGIGLALAKQCVQQGANVTLLARNKLVSHTMLCLSWTSKRESLSRTGRCVQNVQMRLIQAMAEVDRKKKDASQKVCVVSVDITKDPDFVGTSMEEALSTIGPVDILVNCAGFAVCGSFQDTNAEDFRVMMETNYLGSIHVTKSLIDGMISRKHGHIVFLSSIGGQLGIYGYSAYSPSKFAIRGLAEVLYSELKPHNIGVSIVFPPDTDTPGFETENRMKPKATKLISESGGLFSPEDVAKSIITGIKNRRYSICCGSDGFMMNTLTCGAAPASSLSELLIQVLLLSPLRLTMTFYLYSFGRIIQRCLAEEETTQRQKTE